MNNTNALIKEFKEHGLKLKFIAKKLGITYQSLLNKLNNKTDFWASEVMLLTDLLHLDAEARDRLFFAQHVDSKSTHKKEKPCDLPTN